MLYLLYKAEAPRPSETGVFCWGILELSKHEALCLIPRITVELAMVSDSSQTIWPEMVYLKARVLLLSPVVLAPEILYPGSLVPSENRYNILGIPGNYSLPFGNCPRSSSVFLEMYMLLLISHPFLLFYARDLHNFCCHHQKGDSRIGNISSSYIGS